MIIWSHNFVFRARHNFHCFHIYTIRNITKAKVGMLKLFCVNVCHSHAATTEPDLIDYYYRRLRRLLFSPLRTLLD